MDQRESAKVITLDDLRRICPTTKVARLDLFVEPLNATMTEFEVNNPAREAHFLAQIAHESGGFNYMAEIASGEAYDNRADLGNTKPEAVAIAKSHGSTPGRWWKGHGPIQITGYDNHVACGTALDLDLVNHPTLLEIPLHGCRAAGWFWSTHRLNELADVGDIRGVTKKINGGFNGLADRQKYLEKAQRVLA